jgi:hypothetical protein
MSATIAHHKGSPLRRRPSAADALRLPPGFGIDSLLDPERGEAVKRRVTDSPDYTLYHSRPYIEFLRGQGALADVLLVTREGNPLFALPVHSFDGTGLDGGYSGLVFLTTGSERALRRAVAAFIELLERNRHVPFRLIQSAQAPAYDDSARVTLLQALLEERGVVLERLYGRLCDLDGQLPAPEQIPVEPGGHHGALALDTDWLADESLNAYDPDARNQIRQALQQGLRVEYMHAGGPRARGGAAGDPAMPTEVTSEPATQAAAYERFQPVHEESWARTGLLPKPYGYWPALSAAVAAAGGEDLVVLVLDRSGEPLAGVVCHAYQSRAIYWSGCSTAEGLRLHANPLCLHGAIAACRQLGASTFELGRFRADEPSTKERDVTRYKAQFGGRLLRITAFSSRPHALARVRTARAAATAEARRRLALALVRVRARRA